MNPRYIFATVLWITFTALPLLATAHPTNGHLCTEIQEPVRCFGSDGFCEWVSYQCLYRCDLHDTAPDCNDIKDGCAWDGRECVQVPSTLDAGTPPGDSATSEEGDVTVVSVDSSQLEMFLEADSEAHSNDSGSSVGHHDGDIQLVDTDLADEAPHRRSSQDCIVAHTSPLTGYVVVCIFLMLRRRS